MTALTPLLAPNAANVPGPAHQRIDVRSNMFVMAVLYADGGSTPVRIRNMSRSGALIESDVIPGGGLPVRLSRGSLSVRGLIAWRSGNRAGIHFGSAIEVSDWLPRGAKPTGQERVDEMLHACRNGAEAVKPPRTADQAAVVRHLLDGQDALNSVAEELAGCVAIAKTYPTALQRIDVTAQMLGRLASKLGGSD